MASGVTHNIDETRHSLGEARERLPEELLRQIVRHADTVIAGRIIGRYMRDAGPGAGPRQPADTGPLRIVSGRLARAVQGGFGAGEGEGQRESRVRMEIGDEGIVYERELLVPYAAAHEFGATIPVTAAMRRFFWARWYETEEDRWKAMALSKKARIRIPARPYAEPALQDSLPEIVQFAEQVYANFIQSRVA